MTDSAKSSSVQWQRKREQKWLCTFRTATLQVRHPSAWRVGVVSFLAALGPPEQRRRLCSGPAWPPSLFQGPVKGALQDQGSTRRCTAEALVRKYPSPPRHSGTEARPPLRRASRLTRQGFSSTDGGERGLAQRRPSSHPPWGQGCRGQSGAFSSATSAPCQGAAPGGVSRGDAPLRRNRAASPTLLPPPLPGARRRAPALPAARSAPGRRRPPDTRRFQEAATPPPHTHIHTPPPRPPPPGRAAPSGAAAAPRAAGVGPGERRGEAGNERPGGWRRARRGRALGWRPPRLSPLGRGRGGDPPPPPPFFPSSSLRPQPARAERGGRGWAPGSGEPRRRERRSVRAAHAWGKRAVVLG